MTLYSRRWKLRSLLEVGKIFLTSMGCWTFVLVISLWVLPDYLTRLNPDLDFQYLNLTLRQLFLLGFRTCFVRPAQQRRLPFPFHHLGYQPRPNCNWSSSRCLFSQFYFFYCCCRMRRIHSLKSWISVPVTPRQPFVHEDVLSVAAQCYTDPVKICYILFERDVSPSFGIKLTEI